MWLSHQDSDKQDGWRRDGVLLIYCRTNWGGGQFKQVWIRLLQMSLKSQRAETLKYAALHNSTRSAAAGHLLRPTQPSLYSCFMTGRSTAGASGRVSSRDVFLSPCCRPAACVAWISIIY